MPIEEGSLYPALYRLERRGLIEAEWMARTRAESQVLSHHAEGTPPARRRHPGMDAVLRRGVEGAHPIRRMTFGRRLRSRVWRGSVEDEVDAELEFHVAMRARELEARGMSPADAHEAAVRRFGDIEHVNETCRSIGEQRIVVCVAPNISPS